MAGTQVNFGLPARYAYIWRLNSSGIATGQVAMDSTGNVTSSGYMLQNPIALTRPDQPTETRNLRGGGVSKAQYESGKGEITTGQLTLATSDEFLKTLLRGGNLDTSTLAGAQISAENHQQITGNRFGLAVNVEIVSQDASTLDVRKYKTIIYPSCTGRLIEPNPTDGTGTNPDVATLEFFPAAASKFMTGAAFGAAQDWANYREMEYIITADNAYHVTSFKLDGTAVSFVTGFLPTFGSVTGGTTLNWFTTAGSYFAPTSISTTSGSVVFGTAIAAGTNNIVVAFYQTQYDPIPA